MFERFAEDTSRATTRALEEATALGHDFIGTEHLLLGLLAAEGKACAVLNELEVTLDDARRKVAERVHAYGSGSVASPPFTPLAKKALDRALKESLQLRAELIGQEHLLLGLIDVADGGGARIIVELAGSLDQVRQAVLAGVAPPLGAHPSLGAGRPAATGPLRRWAAQSRTVFTSRPGALPTAVAGPTCPSCQAPLALEARYRVLSVPPEPNDAADATMEGEAVAGTPEELARLTVNVVFCGNCGVTLGTA